VLNNSAALLLVIASEAWQSPKEKLY